MYMPAKTTIKAHKRRVHKSHKKPRSSKHHKITVRKLGKRGRRTKRKRVRGGMGRPKGSKNKPKPPAAGGEPEPKSMSLDERIDHYSKIHKEGQSEATKDMDPLTKLRHYHKIQQKINITKRNS